MLAHDGQVFVKRKNNPQHIKGAVIRFDHKALNDVLRHEHEQNVPSDLNSDEVQRLVDSFENDFKEFASITPTFYQLASILMEDKHWTLETFMKKTYLDKSIYSRIMEPDSKKHKGEFMRESNESWNTVASFCVGMGVYIETAKKLFESAGLTIHASKESFAYCFVIREMRGCSIDKCNAFLIQIGVEPLGGKARKNVRR